MHGAPNVPPAWSIGFGFAEIGFVDLLQNYSGSWNAEQSHPIRAPLEGRESIACAGEEIFRKYSGNIQEIYQAAGMQSSGIQSGLHLKAERALRAQARKGQGGSGG